MKKCWFSQIIALSAFYSVLAQSEDLLLRQQQTVQVEEQAQAPSTADILQDSRLDLVIRRDLGDDSLDNELGPITTNSGLSRAVSSQQASDEQDDSQNLQQSTEDVEGMSFDRLIQILNELAGQKETEFEIEQHTEETYAILNKIQQSQHLEYGLAHQETPDLINLADPLIGEKSASFETITDGSWWMAGVAEPNDDSESNGQIVTQQESFLERIMKKLDDVIDPEHLTQSVLDEFEQKLPSGQPAQEKNKTRFIASTGYKNPNLQTPGQESGSGTLNIAEQNDAQASKLQRELPLMMQRTLAQKKSAPQSQQQLQQTVSPYLVYMAAPVLLFSIAAFYS